MKEHLIQLMQEKEIVSTDYMERLNIEFPYFDPHQEILYEYYELKKQRHLIYPARTQLSSSLVLFLLDLNPVDPIKFNIQFSLKKNKIVESLSFYCNESALKVKGKVRLEHLTVLSNLKTVCNYLHLNLEEITKKLNDKTKIKDFLEDLQSNLTLKKKSFIFQQKNMDASIILKDYQATSFEALIVFIHDKYIQQNPSLKKDKCLIGEVFMDVLLVGWIWWLGRLVKK